MSDTIQAIDTILKYLPMLRTLIGTSRREYFNKAVLPMFENFQAVHEFYNELILDVWRKVDDLSPIILSPNAPLTSEQLATLREIKKDFTEKRRKDEHLRDALRRDAQETCRHRHRGGGSGFLFYLFSAAAVDFAWNVQIASSFDGKAMHETSILAFCFSSIGAPSERGGANTQLSMF